MAYPTDDYEPTNVTVQFGIIEGSDSIEVQVQFPFLGVSSSMRTAYSEAVDAAVAAMEARINQEFTGDVTVTVVYTGQRQA